MGGATVGVWDEEGHADFELPASNRQAGGNVKQMGALRKKQVRRKGALHDEEDATMDDLVS
jgi:hypothetical protein